MSEHKAHVLWKRETPDFKYETYNREHDVTFGGGLQIRASAAPEYRELRTRIVKELIEQP